MNTENIKNAILKEAFSDQRTLKEALDVALTHIGDNIRFESIVGWMYNNLRVFGYIFEQEADPFRSNAIKEEDIDFIADIIAENADELAESMPRHLAEAIGLESTIDETEKGKVGEAETPATSTSEGITVYTGVILHPRQDEKHFRSESEAKDYLMKTKKGAHIEVLIPGEERISGFRDTDKGDLSDFTNNALRAWLKGDLGRYKDNLRKKASRAHKVSV